MKLSKEDRDSLSPSDFGLPDERRYPIHDKEHVLLAIKFFGFCEPSNKIELAKNINKKIKEFKMDVEPHGAFAAYLAKENYTKSKTADIVMDASNIGTLSPIVGGVPVVMDAYNEDDDVDIKTLKAIISGKIDVEVDETEEGLRTIKVVSSIKDTDFTAESSISAEEFDKKGKEAIDIAISVKNNVYLNNVFKYMTIPSAMAHDCDRYMKGIDLLNHHINEYIAAKDSAEKNSIVNVIAGFIGSIEELYIRAGIYSTLWLFDRDLARKVVAILNDMARKGIIKPFVPDAYIPVKDVIPAAYKSTFTKNDMMQLTDYLTGTSAEQYQVALDKFFEDKKGTRLFEPNHIYMILEENRSRLQQGTKYTLYNDHVYLKMNGAYYLVEAYTDHVEFSGIVRTYLVLVEISDNPTLEPVQISLCDDKYEPKTTTESYTVPVEEFSLSQLKSRLTMGLKSIHIDKDGNVSINLADKLTFEHYEEIHKVLKVNRETNDYEGMKQNIAYIFSLITTIEREYITPAKQGMINADSKKYQEMIRLRALLISDFKVHLRIIMQHERNFKFLDYYEHSAVNSSTYTLSKKTIQGLGVIFRTIIVS